VGVGLGADFVRTLAHRGLWRALDGQVESPPYGMSINGRLLIALAPGLVLWNVACDPIVKVSTREPATWSYVNEAWGGLAVADPIVSGEQASFPLQFHTNEPRRIDSAICPCAVSARLVASRILIRLDRCVCGSGGGVDLLVQLPRPDPGLYDIVYDEESAGYPFIRKVEVR
jgi:hypothetical protein